MVLASIELDELSAHTAPHTLSQVFETRTWRFLRWSGWADSSECAMDSVVLLESVVNCWRMLEVYSNEI